ncbi:uncharacterized protein AtWU_04075 [Aspergillus tubingensis]|uniref:uncharacterized protein n=1 Tax=Aspergillus tubingensis TaxID=5068 RepID=UPI00157799E8|nr:uncharacterized protein AtWU_04075 [Aspergillus tubingensis]GFN14275.1 hypothetical protein AtWU_04075 [Aspergillus tubingensis]
MRATITLQHQHKYFRRDVKLARESRNSGCTIQQTSLDYRNRRVNKSMMILHEQGKMAELVQGVRLRSTLIPSFTAS